MDIFELSKKTPQEIFNLYNTSFNGLETNEVLKRIKIYGKNILEERKIDLLKIISQNVTNFFMLLLLAAFIFSLILNGLNFESLAILFFFILSTFIAVLQDWKSEKFIESLIKKFKTYTWVKRGSWQKELSENIVPGDYVRFKEGDIISADIFITKSDEAFVNESTFTGEAEPVLKEPSLKQECFPTNIALQGSYVVSGYLEGVVLFTGKNTYLGKISTQAQLAEKESAYKKIMEKIAKNVGYFSLILISLTFILNLIFLKHPLKEMIIFSIVLFVAVVPEFLPLITTLSLTISSLKISKKGIIPKRISAIEDLGAIKFLCTDKTGTLTENKLKLIEIFSDDKEKFIKFFLAPAILKEEFDSYETAFIQKYGILKIEGKIEKEFPFNPYKRKKEYLLSLSGKKIKVTKGAPEEIFKEFENSEKIENLKKIFEEKEKLGLRCLGLMIEEDKKELLGIAIFEDPLKKDAKKIIKLAKNLNLEIKILTGDSPGVSKKVALELGIIKNENEIITSDELKRLSDEELDKVVQKVNVFARLYPEDKARIINSLKKYGFVGFLGEGINDLLAIKSANVSIVVDSAPEVTRQESDLLLKKRSLKPIIVAIKEGRKDIENIEKYIRHTLVGNFGNLIAFTFISIFSKTLPLTPLQIIATNIITDFPMIGVINDKVSKEVLRNPPRFDYFSNLILFLILGVILSLALIYAFYQYQGNLAQTVVFLLSSVVGVLILLSIRTKNLFFKERASGFVIFLILLCVFISFLLTQLGEKFNFSKITLKEAIYVLGLSIITLFVLDFAKFIFFRALKKLGGRRDSNP